MCHPAPAHDVHCSTRPSCAGPTARELPSSSTPAPWSATRSCSWSSRQRAHDLPLPPRPGSSATGEENLFAGLVAAWLWFTVLFANFAEAVAEGRGKAQADTLRKARTETTAHRRRPDGDVEDVASSALQVGDKVVCRPAT